ncbi:periplasmic binding protein-like II [Tilletiaria anomala UBC 951]|uniref:Periplasmic binding protein-like II n=1 Tax=Tilletiaria anomala (strain ATCC 24038 / CBS 436.72 / UBC 951) TaxID=1037660 RepID=A0A066V5I0_TILAU|nr:periplasmic binding protein-like II [Tilletiaria anomala UBC 951]KDN35503.1 periplasmic binding protein-like II [Tilletiaria anomala UBC 951]
METVTSPNILRIRQGRIDLSFHQVVGEVFAYVLSDPRLFLSSLPPSPDTISSLPLVDLSVSSAPHADAFAALQKGETDILVGWFDGSHGTYLEPFQKDVIVLGDPSKNISALPDDDDVAAAAAFSSPPVYSPYCIWGVPSYVPEALVPDVRSLANIAIAARFKKEEGTEKHVLQGIAPGAGISRFSREMLHKYGLNEAGWEFRNGSQEDCFSAFEKAVEKEEWIVIPLWHPQYLHAHHSIRALKEPQGLLRPVDHARLVLRKDFLKQFSPQQRSAILGVLQRVTLGNSAVTEMDSYVHVDKLDYRSAARKWIRAHQAQVDSWFENGHVDIVQRATQLDQYLLEDEAAITAKQHAYAIPARAPAAAGAYSPFSTSTTAPQIIHTSFQLPFGPDGKLAYVGPILPNDASASKTSRKTITEDEGLAAARLCALNLLAQLRDAASGDLARVQLLRLEGYVATADVDGHFVNVPRILNGASLLIRHALGAQRGAHSRTALTLSTNPLDVPTMIGAVAELRW